MHNHKKNLLNNISEILALVDDKAIIDQNGNWCQGSKTYFEEIHKEIDEAQAEYIQGKSPHLEDELGDILWDYLNLLKNLELEERITLENVFTRCTKKYHERLAGIKNGEKWNDIKNKQKKELKKE
jgi:NTP pyrophosphatase (non-canonical NTP hydrolase)